ncbi:hypothetical protein EVAR_8805_1 [Eumeta japonica]|uniref:Uncharacterized protein n=1 Tax=Eumeta variegata TaxID=151549 RepID=A0A4C1TTV5_EUMVA|nr:hypothetical protein EVAR_8805_1 [Eumeta japonica]
MAVLHHYVDIFAINDTWLRLGEKDKAPKILRAILSEASPAPAACAGARWWSRFYVRKSLEVLALNRGQKLGSIRVAVHTQSSPHCLYGLTFRIACY